MVGTANQGCIYFYPGLVPQLAGIFMKMAKIGHFALKLQFPTEYVSVYVLCSINNYIRAFSNFRKVV